jgi:hypothetical protein
MVGCLAVNVMKIGYNACSMPSQLHIYIAGQRVTAATRRRPCTEYIGTSYKMMVTRGGHLYKMMVTCTT